MSKSAIRSAWATLINAHCFEKKIFPSFAADWITELTEYEASGIAPHWLEQERRLILDFQLDSREIADIEDMRLSPEYAGVPVSEICQAFVDLNT